MYMICSLNVPRIKRLEKIVRRNLRTQPPPIMDQQYKLILTTFQSKPYYYSIIETSRKQQNDYLS